MADEYDPLDPPTYNAADEAYDPAEHDDQGEGATGDGDDHGDDESDYDPSSYNYDNRDENATPASVNSSQQQTATDSVQAPPTKAKTRAGFIVDESDDEKEDEGVSARLPQGEPTGAHSGSGAVAASEAQDISLHSAPQDTVASSTSLNGSTTVPVPASISPVPESTPQHSFASQGKVISSAPQATSTPQPPTDQAPNAANPVQSRVSTSLPTRLPHDKVGQLEDRIKDDPKGDANAWASLIDHYREKGQYDFARSVFERFFQAFPYAVRYLSFFLFSLIYG